MKEFRLRVPKEIHEKLNEIKPDDRSLTEWIVEILEQRISEAQGKTESAQPATYEDELSKPEYADLLDRFRETNLYFMVLHKDNLLTKYGKDKVRELSEAADDYSKGKLTPEVKEAVNEIRRLPDKDREWFMRIAHYEGLLQAIEILGHPIKKDQEQWLTSMGFETGEQHDDYVFLSAAYHQGRKSLEDVEEYLKSKYDEYTQAKILGRIKRIKPLKRTR